MSISILLVDDHTILRQGLQTMLMNEPDFKVVGEANDGLEVMLKVEKLHPDVIVLDLAMPGLNGVEVIRQVRQRYPDIRIVVLSMHSKEAYVYQSLKNGANAYVLKGAEIGELILAIRMAMQDVCYLSPQIPESAVFEFEQKTQQQDLDRYERLTNRERQILQMTAEGLSSSQIGEKLCISYRTVEVHRAHIMRKLGLEKHTDLIRYALQKGIISLDDWS